MRCRICSNEAENTEYCVREMMLGTRDHFKYFKCSKCQCLQISDFPQNIANYYPNNYYSFASKPQRASTLRLAYRRLRSNFTIFGAGLVGRLGRRLLTFPPNWECLKPLKVTKKTRLLDVGCGTGCKLYVLSELGMDRILGVDPFIENNMSYDTGLKIVKGEISDIKGEWDIITFHHSFEHVRNPLEVLLSVSKLLSKNGHCVVCIPVVSSYAWDHYGTDWVQLDAPRHYYLHSPESIRLLASKAGLTVTKIVYNSAIFQFTGSEQYKKDIPLVQQKTAKVAFDAETILQFQQLADKLNQEQRGDQAIFYLSLK